MSYRKLTLWMVLVISLGLGACRGAPPEGAATDTPGAGGIASETAAPTQEPAVTVAFETPQPTLPVAPSETVAAGGTPQATAEGTAGTPSGTQAVGTPAGTPGQAGAGDRAEFVADVTVPDGSNFAPGAAFVKTWQLRNSGTTTWDTSYALVYVRGEQMGGPAAVPLTANVAPGQTVDISVDMVAPAATGSYTGFWQMRTAAGGLFGVGGGANEPIYVQINVVPDAGTGGTVAPGPTGEAGAIQVTGATLAVDQATRTGACPQTFAFTGNIQSTGAGSVSYVLQAEADTPGFVFNLPAPNTSNFTGAGPRNFGVAYNMEFNGSVSGQMWLQVTAPNDVSSNRLSFSLTCDAAPTATP